MEKYLYLTIDLAAILLPLLFSFHSSVGFSKKWKYVWPAIGLTALIFLAWDSWFTSMGVWGFTPRYLTGHFILNLPIEEVLFFICIPYACLFLYETVNHFRTEEPLPYNGRKITWILAAGSLAAGIKYSDRWYPAVVFLALSAVLLLYAIVVRPSFLGRFYFSYLFILVPFFVINGILTGTGLSEPVVWYNPSETIGLRLLSIPIEDAFYGMLLILVNVSIFEFLQKRFPTTS